MRCFEVNADPVVYHWTYKLDEISEDEAKNDVASEFLFNVLECVSKCREMQFRGHQVAFQGEKPQAYWLQVKVFQHRNAA
jgi:hypothetical protein